MASLHPIKVIVAEDEDLIRGRLVKKIEAFAGGGCCKVIGEAQNGREALELVKRDQPDLVFTDIRMPVMDGMELIQKLHRYYPRVRLVITSGYADFTYARQALQYKVNDYLLKPISTAELYRVLTQVTAQINGDKVQLESSLKELPPPGAGTEELVHMVQSYMRENYRTDLSLEHIAQQFNFSAAYLSKIFMKHTGEAPSRYLISLRINEAKYLLTNHRSLSVKEVGEHVGYRDPFYFSRIFKQMTGRTPKEYQKECGDTP